MRTTDAPLEKRRRLFCSGLCDKTSRTHRTVSTSDAAPPALPDRRRRVDDGGPSAPHLTVDAWDHLCSFLDIRDRRAFAATSRCWQRLDHDAWESQHSLALAPHLHWHDLWYLGLAPLESLVAPSGERLERCERASPRDVQLCVCHVARQVASALRTRQKTVVFNIDVYARATRGNARLFHGVRDDDRSLIASIGAMSQNPKVRSFPRQRHRFAFFWTMAQCIRIFRGVRTFDLALQALPWSWLWHEVDETLSVSS